MRRTLPWLVAALAACLLAGCSSDGRDREEPEAANRCHGVDHADVKGMRPSYAGTTLHPYAADSAVCAAYRLDRADNWFVPQGLAISGDTAFISGYRWRERGSERACQLLVVDIVTGQTREFLGRLEAPVHGARPIEGSALVIDDGRLGLAGYDTLRRGRIFWFRLDHVLAPGRTLLARAENQGRVPRRLQGITAGPGGIWLSSSRTHCAELKIPGRPPLEFVPGAEDLEVSGDDVWTLGEASARPYLQPGEAVVPMLLRLDRSAVLDGHRADCGW